MSNPALELRDVWLSFRGRPVLEAVDLTVEQGDFVGIRQDTVARVKLQSSSVVETLETLELQLGDRIGDHQIWPSFKSRLTRTNTMARSAIPRANSRHCMASRPMRSFGKDQLGAVFTVALWPIGPNLSPSVPTRSSAPYSGPC